MVGLAGERALTRAAPGARAARPGPDTAVVLRADDGQLLALDTSRWHREPTPVERRLLGTLPGPVLDVGCGPGRLVVGLARLGCPALGVDTAPAAVHLARRRGASVLQRSVFDPLPGERRWRGILLVDGNIGIGGDPVRLLRRARPAGAGLVHPPGPTGAGPGSQRLVRLGRGGRRRHRRAGRRGRTRRGPCVAGPGGAALVRRAAPPRCGPPDGRPVPEGGRSRGDRVGPSGRRDR